MNQSHGIVLASFLALLSISSHAVSVTNDNRQWSFTVGAGEDYFASKRHIDNAGVDYGALGYYFNDHWGVEGLLGGFITDSNRPEDNNSQVRGTLFAMDAVYRFDMFHAIQPYVMAGPGVIGMNPNGDDANNEGNINAALGAQLFFSKNVALRVEARDFYTMVGGKNDVFLNAGVSFLWDLC
jgi:hypothetical protein